MSDDHGASHRELLMEACRRNNTSLLEEVLAELSTAGGEKATEHIAKTLNDARDGIGNGVLHLAASNGACTCEEQAPTTSLFPIALPYTNPDSYG